MKEVNLNTNSLLVRWFFFISGKNADYYNQPWCGVDICKFRLQCFLWGPLEVSIVLTILSVFSWLLVISPIIEYGIIPTLIALGLIVGVVGTVIGTLFGICWFTQKSADTAVYKSFKEKYCSKVRFVEGDK